MRLKGLGQDAEKNGGIKKSGPESAFVDEARLNQA